MQEKAQRDAATLKQRCRAQLHTKTQTMAPPTAAQTKRTRRNWARHGKRRLHNEVKQYEEKNENAWKNDKWKKSGIYLGISTVVFIIGFLPTILPSPDLSATVLNSSEKCRENQGTAEEPLRKSKIAALNTTLVQQERWSYSWLHWICTFRSSKKTNWRSQEDYIIVPLLTVI